MTLEFTLAAIRRARLYSKDMLSHIDEADWFRQPEEGVTHVAWQVGHVATAQYNLALKRVRGERAEDEQLIPPEFRQLYGKGSTPNPDAAANPSVQEIRTIFGNVHAAVLEHAGNLDAATLAEPSEPKHPMFRDKLGALRWSAEHEFMHVGQIALLRRLLGAEPLR